MGQKNKTKDYDPSNVVVTDKYVVNQSGDRFFIPVNTQDTMSQQLDLCERLSPFGVEVVQ